MRLLDQAAEFELQKAGLGSNEGLHVDDITVERASMIAPSTMIALTTTNVTHREKPARALAQYPETLTAARQSLSALGLAWPKLPMQAAPLKTMGLPTNLFHVPVHSCNQDLRSTGCYQQFPSGFVSPGHLYMTPRAALCYL